MAEKPGKLGHGRNGEERRKVTGGRGSGSLDDEETVQVCLHALGLDM